MESGELIDYPFFFSFNIDDFGIMTLAIYTS